LNRVNEVRIWQKEILRKMVLEEGKGSLGQVAMEYQEREKERINKVVSWLLEL